MVWTHEMLPIAVPGQPELAHAFLSKPCCIMTDGLTGCVTPVFVVQVDTASKPCCIMTDGLTGCVTPVFVVQVDTASKPCCIMTDGLTGCVTPVFVVQLDTVTQRLIGVLGKAGPGKAADNRMYDANIACRKLAARHPMLILR